MSTYKHIPTSNFLTNSSPFFKISTTFTSISSTSTNDFTTFLTYFLAFSTNFSSTRQFSSRIKVNSTRNRRRKKFIFLNTNRLQHKSYHFPNQDNRRMFLKFRFFYESNLGTIMVLYRYHFLHQQSISP